MTLQSNCSAARNEGKKFELDLEKYFERDNNHDVLTPVIGDFGTWQLGVSLSANLINVAVFWHQFAIIFLAPPIEFQCLSHVSSNHSCFSDEGDPCTQWEYNTTIFKNTIVSEWNLICDREELIYISQSLYMLGSLLGNFFFGIISDKFGRKTPFQIAIALMFLAGLGVAFAPTFSLFTVFRFFDAIGTGGAMVISFVIGIEAVGTKSRGTVSLISQLLFVLGHLTLPGVSFIFRNWRHFQLAISIPLVLALTFYWAMPQSPRWLLTVGRTDKAIEILQKAAKTNRLPLIDTSEVKTLKANPKTVLFSFINIFRYLKLKKRTLVLFFSWFACAFCYYGLLLLLGRLKGDIFENVAIGGAIQIPGALIGFVCLERIGRRKTLFGAQIISGIACLCFAIIPLGFKMKPLVEIILITVAITGTLVGFAANYLFTAELFPTIIRNAAVGFGATVGRIGTIIAPLIMGWNSPHISFIIFGTISCIGGLLCFFLPETKNAHLLDTVEETEEDLKSFDELSTYALFARINKKGNVIFERRVI